MILERVMQGIIKRKKLDIALRVETASCLTYLRRGTVIPKSQQVCYKESGVLGQYIPSGNEDILHRRFNIYCNCLRIYTASANEVYLHFQRSRIGKLWTFILRSCFEFLQKVFLGLMYPFSCVLWAIFWSFSLLLFVR